MVYKTPRFIKVGKRAKDDSKKISLLGITLEPNQVKGNILFLQGFSGHFEDYFPHFLLSLAETFKVEVYNYRGHLGSKGKFDVSLSSQDAETMLEKIGAPASLLAHSYGANIATHMDSGNIQRTYCINPLFDSQMLPFLSRAGIRFLRAASFVPGLLQIPDYMLDSAGLAKKAGFQNRHTLQSLASLAKLEETEHDKPMAFALSDSDEVLGTRNNSARYLLLMDRIKSRYRHAENRSELVRELNHCLNLNKNDFTPFLKPEKGKDSDRIIEDIINFYLK